MEAARMFRGCGRQDGSTQLRPDRRQRDGRAAAGSLRAVLTLERGSTDRRLVWAPRHGTPRLPDTQAAVDDLGTFTEVKENIFVSAQVGTRFFPPSFPARA